MNKTKIINASELTVQGLFLLISVIMLVISEDRYLSHAAFEGLYLTGIINTAVLVVYLSVRLILLKKTAMEPLQLGMLLFLIYNLVPIFMLIPLVSVRLLSALCFTAAAAIFLLKNIIGSQAYGVQDAKKGLKLASGFVLIFFSVVFFLRGVYNIIQYFSGAVDIVELSVSISDMIVSVIWCAAGIGFIRQSAFGKKNVLPVCIQSSLLFLTLIVFLLVNPVINDDSIDPEGVIVVTAMGIFFFVPTIMLLRAGRKS